MKETKHLCQNQKRTAFPWTHPQAHGSIFFHFCMNWRTFVYGRRSNAEADLSFSLHVHTDTVLLFLTLQSSFVSPPTTMSFLLCYLYSFLIKVLWKKKKALARSYSTCAWTYGWKTLCAQHCDDISWRRKAANVFVTSCSPAFPPPPPPGWGEKGITVLLHAI